MKTLLEEQDERRAHGIGGSCLPEQVLLRQWEGGYLAVHGKAWAPSLAVNSWFALSQE